PSKRDKDARTGTRTFVYQGGDFYISGLFDDQEERRSHMSIDVERGRRGRARKLGRVSQMPPHSGAHSFVIQSKSFVGKGLIKSAIASLSRASLQFRDRIPSPCPLCGLERILERRRGVRVLPGGPEG